ncbi:tyrosine-type recombinase/integrase [Tsukamurella pseudospumae]|nr:tyrosine-type recombinase/integrase [Tsukamurella pseudospumae]
MSTVLCTACTKAHRAAGGTREQFLASYVVPHRKRRGGRRNPGLCVVRDPGPEGQRCGRMPLSHGLCEEHQIEWYNYSRYRAITAGHRQAWATSIASPLAAVERCLVLGCDMDSSFTTKICTLHRRRYGASGKRVPVEQWAATQTPATEANLASLVPLPEQLRWEILYALTIRDKRAQAGGHGGRIEPAVIRAIVKKLAPAASEDPGEEAVVPVTLVAPAGSERHQRLTAMFTRNANGAAHIAEFMRSVTAAHDRCFGIAPTSTSLWHLSDLDGPDTSVAPARDRRGKKRGRVKVDFADITVVWLRDLMQLWIAGEREHIPPATIPETLRAVIAASKALEHRPGGGQDPTAVALADLDAIVETIRNLTALDDPERLLTSKTRAGHLRRFFDLLEYGHTHGHLTALAPTFFRRRHHHIQILTHEREERARHSVPDHAITVLDQHLDLIAATNPYPGLTDEQRQQMGRCLYILLRDTGRRPNEICSLDRDCLIDGSEPELRWNNTKSNRPSRRLPITTGTAAEIRTWQGIRTALLTHPDSNDYLFPTHHTGQRNRPLPGLPHLNTSTLRTWIVDWAADVNNRATDHLGRPRPLDGIRIFPYAFRHSYAQRHVDAGVDVDVLRELMDHKSISTTIGYYDISTTRKRAAVSTVAKHVIDRTGKHVPTTATTYGLRTVAVPYGSCTEPTNVKSGGTECPIRFHCAGCAFYRSDPSYIPALEQHILALKTNRETALASDAADYVITSLTSDIDAFTGILHTMRARIDQLSESDRDDLTTACTTLHLARAGAQPVPLPTPRTRHAAAPDGTQNRNTEEDL